MGGKHYGSPPPPLSNSPPFSTFHLFIFLCSLSLPKPPSLSACFISSSASIHLCFRPRLHPFPRTPHYLVPPHPCQDSASLLLSGSGSGNHFYFWIQLQVNDQSSAPVNIINFPQVISAERLFPT